jgi:hypothetical protein
MLDALQERDHVYSTFLSTYRPEVKRRAYPPTSIVFGEADPPKECTDALSSSIESLCGSPPTLSNFPDVDVAGKICVFVAELADPLLTRLDENGFLALKKMITSAKRVLCVSIRGTMDSNGPRHFLDHRSCPYIEDGER